MTRSELAKIIDHTMLRPDASQCDIDRLCDEAEDWNMANVAVNSGWVAYCAKRLANTEVGIAATVGFPLGAVTAHVKVEEAREAVENGASEIDMVINIGALKSHFPEFVVREIEAVVKTAAPARVKVILETCYLTESEKMSVCEMSIRARAAHVKTSTGFGDHGATREDVALLRRMVGVKLGVKAAGGIRTYREAVAMVNAGASRIGTSAGVQILEAASSP